MLKNILSARQVIAVRLLIFLFGLSALFRFVFFAVFASTAHELSGSVLFKALYIGFKFDLRVCLVVALPFLLVSVIPSLNPAVSARARRGWHWFYLLIAAFLVFVNFADLGYYQYLNGRINATVLQFFDNPAISFEMVWQTYPIIWGSLLYALLVSGLHWTLKRFVFDPQLPSPKRPPLKIWTTGILLTVLVLAGLYGKLSYYPLRWSEAFFSGHNFVSAMAINPIHNFFDTLANRDKTYDIKKVKRYYKHVSEFLGVDQPNKDSLNFERKQLPTALTPPGANPNIVVIIMESLAAHRTGTFGNPTEATPILDGIAKEAWSFEHFYTPSVGTARGIFTLITGLSDINKGRTSSRNPLIIDQNTAVNAFTDHEKFYFIGGSANWGNIRGILMNNISGLKLIEEGQFQSGRTDVWGVSDYHLFKEAHQMLSSRQSKKPFFAFIQTAGYHRPYSIPEDHGNFEVKSPNEDFVKQYGFKSLKEYNSLRFADYSLGHFIELAKQGGYFDNTLFVILGDHGIPDNGAKHLTPTMKQFSLEKYHTPLVFYGPKFFKPKSISEVIGQHDVMPTLASITGHKFINKGLGRNVFDPRFKNSRYTFSYVYYDNPHTVFLYDQQHLVTGRAGKITGLFDYHSPDTPQNLASKMPEKFEQMKTLLDGIYETSKYLLYNNEKVPQK